MSIMDRFRLDGKVALVAGAGRGIGAAIAEALADAGATVAITARTQSQLDEVAARIEASGGTALTIACDGTDADAVAAAVERTATELGRIDVVVNVVGGSMPAPFLQTSDKALAAAFQNNVVTALRLARLTTPHLLAAGGGSIVFVSSAIGHVVGRGYLAYGAAKGSLDHATRLAAADLSPRIRVNAVSPGAILTDALEVVASDPNLKAAIEAGTPLRRLGEPDDIAAATLFLASDASSYITGQILAVDGGLLKVNLDMPLPDL